MVPHPPRCCESTLSLMINGTILTTDSMVIYLDGHGLRATCSAGADPGFDKEGVMVDISCKARAQNFPTTPTFTKTTPTNARERR